jgi:hypothetical protein
MSAIFWRIAELPAGKGLTDTSEHWLVKAIVGYGFKH